MHPSPTLLFSMYRWKDFLLRIKNTCPWLQKKKKNVQGHWTWHWAASAPTLHPIPSPSSSPPPPKKKINRVRSSVHPSPIKSHKLKQSRQGPERESGRYGNSAVTCQNLLPSSNALSAGCLLGRAGPCPRVVPSRLLCPREYGGSPCSTNRLRHNGRRTCSLGQFRKRFTGREC